VVASAALAADVVDVADQRRPLGREEVARPRAAPSQLPQVLVAVQLRVKELRPFACEWLIVAASVIVGAGGVVVGWLLGL
jgi:hypothetical protein